MKTYAPHVALLAILLLPSPASAGYSVSREYVATDFDVCGSRHAPGEVPDQVAVGVACYGGICCANMVTITIHDDSGASPCADVRLRGQFREVTYYGVFQGSTTVEVKDWDYSIEVVPFGALRSTDCGGVAATTGTVRFEFFTA